MKVWQGSTVYRDIDGRVEWRNAGVHLHRCFQMNPRCEMYSSDATAKFISSCRRQRSRTLAIRPDRRALRKISLVRFNDDESYNTNIRILSPIVKRYREENFITQYISMWKNSSEVDRKRGNRRQGVTLRGMPVGLMKYRGNIRLPSRAVWITASLDDISYRPLDIVDMRRMRPAMPATQVSDDRSTVLLLVPSPLYMIPIFSITLPSPLYGTLHREPGRIPNA